MSKNSEFLKAINPAIRFAADKGIGTDSREFAECIVNLFYPEAEGEEREQVIRETMESATRR